MHSHKHVKFFIIQILFFALNLTGCTSLPPPEANQADKFNMNIKSTSQTAEGLSSWNMIGALAARKNKSAWSASITWQQIDKNNYRIHLFAPLGGGGVFLEKKNAILTYQDNQKISHSSHEEELIYQQTGVSLPVHQLFYWIRGLQAPGHVQLSERNSNGHLIKLRQSGYTVFYSDYILVDNIPLPTKIRLESPNSLVKVIIKHWDIHA